MDIIIGFTFVTGLVLSSTILFSLKKQKCLKNKVRYTRKLTSKKQKKL